METAEQVEARKKRECELGWHSWEPLSVFKVAYGTLHSYQEHVRFRCRVCGIRPSSAPTHVHAQEDHVPCP